VKAIVNFLALALAVSIGACTAIQVGSEVNSGRRALLISDNESALAYFQSAAQKDPTYVYGTALRQGIWSYVGRTEYLNGRLPQAKETLERALAGNQEEQLARLYLGLTLARLGDRQRGLKEIESGLKGIYDWLEYITQAFRFSFGQYWDPNGQIRKAIEDDLAMISTREFDWEKLIGDAEWVGKQFEEESDRARGDETRARNREGDGRRNSRN
jgi:tetratricopeptide (TPR) repeat protein